MKTRVVRALSIWALLLQIETAHSAEFEKLGAAVAKALGTSKAFRAPASSGTTAFFAKDGSGKPARFAVVEKGMYEPNCTHTWVIAIDARKVAVEQIRVVEMSCPHAFPTNKATFLDQYKGKGPADMKSLKSEIHTIAKATGSSNLTTDAVIRAVSLASSMKGKL